LRHKGSNTGKRARWKNLRHPRERFLVSNEALPSWRPIEIILADGCFLDRLLLLDFNLFHPGSKGKQKMGEGNKQFDVN
jgi:hypothetical protein